MLPCRIEFIRSAMAAIRSKCPDKKIVLGLDALNNVIVDPAITDEYVTAKLIADQLEEILTEFNVLFVGTGHLRKNDGRRPGLDDLKGNNFLAYDLKVAIGIYNEAKRRCRSGATRRRRRPGRPASEAPGRYGERGNRPFWMLTTGLFRQPFVTGWSPAPNLFVAGQHRLLGLICRAVKVNHCRYISERTRLTCPSCVCGVSFGQPARTFQKPTL
jgi:hypothetical protein